MMKNPLSEPGLFADANLIICFVVVWFFVLFLFSYYCLRNML